jgi:hypothetical protein
MQQAIFEKSKPTFQLCTATTKSPLPASRRGPYILRDDVNLPLICPTCQGRDRSAGDNENREPSMYYVAAALAVLSGLFYAAGNQEVGSLGTGMCEYGGAFCDHPSYVLVAAALAAAWGTFVSIR